MEVTYIPDTNFFLECRDPAECPWDDITDASSIRLVLVWSVRSEIDGLKNAGKGRQSNRARKWMSKIREMKQGNKKLVLRQSSPRLELVLAPIVEEIEGLPAILKGDGDRQIIRDVLSVNQRLPEYSGIFLTDDTGAADLAEAGKLACVEVPLDPESGSRRWRLDPENNAKDRRIHELEENLRSLSARDPQIRIAFRNAENDEVSELHASVKQFQPLSLSDIEKVRRAVLARWPAKANFAEHPPEKGDSAFLSIYERFAGSVSVWRGPSDEDIKKYTNVDRPAWERKITSILERLHILLSLPSRTIAFGIHLTNDGNCPAESAALSIETTSGLTMCKAFDPSGSDVPNIERFVASFPSPPTPPSGRYVGGFADLASALGSHHRSSLPIDFASISRVSGIKKPDPDKFYWRDNFSGLVTNAELICQSFRHRHKPYEKHLRLLVSSNDIRDGRGNLRLRFVANNLPTPATRNISIHVEYVYSDTLKEALHMVHADTESAIEDDNAVPKFCDTHLPSLSAS